MVRYLAQAAVAVALSVSFASASQPTCGPGSPCPKEAPCCSMYGKCGVGAYCLGGCDPLFSHSLQSCMPAPTCQSNDYTLSSLDDIQGIDQYLGDATKANWVSSGKPVEYNDGVLLTMAQDTGGTLLASTHYVWYGKISAKLTTAQGKGVITAFIMMSDVRDEIDFEFVGVDIDQVQSNYYSQGVTNYNHGMNLSASNTPENVHEYTLDWTPDELTWMVDKKPLRTLKRNETWNSTSNRFDYPQTPSRIMLSLWPAGLSSNAEGTVQWSGGLIDWNSPYMHNGYYSAWIGDVSVECYDPPPGATRSGSKAYIYNGQAGTNDTIAIVDQNTVLSSFYATGENPGNNPAASSSASASASASKTGSSAAATSSADIETVPGMSGGGNQQIGASAVHSSAPGSTGTATGVSGASSTGFNQGTSAQTGTAAGGLGKERLGGSVFAVCVAVLGLLVL